MWPLKGGESRLHVGLAKSFCLNRYYVDGIDRWQSQTLQTSARSRRQRSEENRTIDWEVGSGQWLKQGVHCLNFKITITPQASHLNIVETSASSLESEKVLYH